MNRKPKSTSDTLAERAIQQVGVTKAYRALRYIALHAAATDMSGRGTLTTREVAKVMNFSEPTLYRLREAYELAFPEMPIEVVSRAVIAEFNGRWRSRSQADAFVIGSTVVPS